MDLTQMVAGRVGPVVDSNVHLWDQRDNPVFWLQDRTLVRDMLGDYDSLPDCFALADYSDATSGFDVRGVVWSDAGAADPGGGGRLGCRSEHCWAGDRPGSARRPDQLRVRVAGVGAAEESPVTSVRVRLIPALRTGPSAAPTDVADRLTEGIALLADQGLVATIEAGASEIRLVADLAHRFPGLSVVLDYSGWPDDLSDAGRRNHLHGCAGWPTSQCRNSH